MYIENDTALYIICTAYTENDFLLLFSSKILKYDYLNRWHFEKFVNYNTI